MFESNRKCVFNNRFSILKIGIISLFILAFSFAQEPPEDFEFNISIYQSFYFFLESDIDGNELDIEEDWIASFNIYDETYEGVCSYIGQDLDSDPETDDCQDLNNDGQLTENAEICIGSYYWDGPYTTVPVMGNDGTRWTEGYIEEGQMPIFKIYDASENIIYPAVPSMIYPWTPDLNFYVVSISVLRDCNDIIGGSAVIDDCENCVEGNTGLDFNYADLGCGCYEPVPDPYYEDIDGDSLGYGDIQYFCEHPGLGWSENNYDQFPECFYNFYDCNNDCGGNAFLDDCDSCVGGLTGNLANSDIDCNGVCFGGAFFDECDYCVGGNTDKTCDLDCIGVWGGNAYLDNCEICDIDTENNNLCLDCSGTVDGNAYIDNCGNCIEPEDEEIYNCNIDCEGVWGGNYNPTLYCSDGELVCNMVDCSISGCTNTDACNYDASATDDDGSCQYASECYDCHGNCTCGEDCLHITPDLLPDKFGIKKIFPNPFNPETIIEYQISKPTNIMISIYNIKGQKINELKNEYILPGYYSINWNGSFQPSGIYFVILSSNETTIWEKIILLK